MTKASLKILAFLLSAFLSVYSYAQSIEQQVQEEISGYIEGLQSSNILTVTNAAAQIHASGLSDKTLSNALEHKLKEYHANQLENRKDKDLVIAMKALMRAYTSSAGDKSYLLLDQIQNESKQRKSRNLAKHLKTKISWYKTRNQIMQDMSNHKAGQSLLTTRYLNLLSQETPYLKRYAAEEINRTGSAEKPITDLMLSELKVEIYQDPQGIKIDQLAWFCRTLTKITKNQYRDDIQQIVDDKSVHKKIRRHCRKALKQV